MTKEFSLNLKGSNYERKPMKVERNQTSGETLIQRDDVCTRFIEYWDMVIHCWAKTGKIAKSELFWKNTKLEILPVLMPEPY